ncbi:MAG: undecaprenyl-diphosphate phosphatase [Halioglobus sp.]
MIDWYQAIILALLQGFTEFLPISSSAHLVLPSLILNWPDQGLAFDVAVHVGTLLAVLWYYRADLQLMSRDWFASLAGGSVTDNSRSVWYLAVATVPVGAVGLLGRGFIESELRSLLVIASTTLFFGLLLGLADRVAGGRGQTRLLSLSVAILIGVAQSIALIPGVSRSGATITAGLFLGLGRQAAARFSFLLSIPVIASAGALKVWDLYRSGASVDWLILAVGAAVSGLTAYLCIALFIRLLDRVGMAPFVYYRVFLALALYGLWLL